MPTYEVTTKQGTFEVSSERDLTPEEVMKMALSAKPVEDSAAFESRLAKSPDVPAMPFFDPSQKTPEQKVETFATDIERLYEGAKEMVTGEQRGTERTRAASSLYTHPLMIKNPGRAAGFALASLSSSIEESDKIFKNMFPEAEFELDEKGNTVYVEDGKDFSLDPGLAGEDFVRGVAKAAQMYPSGRLGSAIAKALGGMATEATHQGIEAIAGGTFDKAPIAFEGAVPLGVQLSKSTLGEVVQQPELQRFSQDALRGVPLEQGFVKPNTEIKARTVEDVERKAQGFARTAAGAAKGSREQTEELIDLAEFDPRRVQAAESLEVQDYVQPDHLSTDRHFIALNQVAKSQPKSKAKAVEEENLNAIGQKMVKLVKDFGGREDLGTFSNDVEDFMNKEIKVLKGKSDKLYNKINEMTPTGTKVNPVRTKNYLDEKAAKMGGFDKLSKLEKRVYQELGLDKIDDAGEASLRPKYQGDHQAPTREDGASIDDVSEVFGEDMYSNKAKQYYSDGMGMDDSIDIIQSFKNNPDAEITIYRAVPKGVQDEINAGDWVTINRDYADQHGLYFDEGYDIIEKKVKASDIHTDGNSIHEWGYNPSLESLPTDDALPTYHFVDELRKEVGELSKPGPFADAERTKAEKLYQVMTGDQGDIAKELGFEQEWKDAKSLIKTRKATEDNMKALFGKQIDKDFVAPLLSSTKELGEKRSKRFLKMLNAIPKEKRKEFTATGLLAAFGRANADGELNYTSFANFYEGMLKDKTAKNAFYSNLPKKARDKIDDIGQLSIGIRNAIAKRERTGRALAGQIDSIDSFIGKIYDIAKTSMKIGGPVMMFEPNAGLFAGIGSALYDMKTNKPLIDKVDDLLSSKPFRNAAFEFAEKGRISDNKIKTLANTAPFKRIFSSVAKDSNASEREAWIMRAMEESIKTPLRPAVKAQPEEENQ